jgi:hypothetical protein
MLADPLPTRANPFLTWEFSRSRQRLRMPALSHVVRLAPVGIAWVVAPGVRALAPALLAGYRSLFGGRVYVPGGAWPPEQARAAAREGRGYEPGTEPVLFPQ